MKVPINVVVFFDTDLTYKGKGFLYPSGKVRLIATVRGKPRIFRIDPTNYGKDKRRLQEKVDGDWQWSKFYLMSMEVDPKQVKILGGVYKKPR